MDLRQRISTANRDNKPGGVALAVHAGALAGSAAGAPSSVNGYAAAIGCPSITLTRREREVLELLCHRLTDPEIAHHLCIGTRTVESHVARILDKLHAWNRRQAAAAAIVLGLN
jgi:DNA-binding NarL/FixJ family response regulator